MLLFDKSEKVFYFTKFTKVKHTIDEKSMYIY